MTRDGTRQIAAFVVAVLAMLLLAACGGSDSTTSSDSTSTETGVQDAGTGSSGQGNAKKAQSEPEEKGKEKKKASGTGKSGDSGGGSSFDDAVPLKVSGGGSAQFLVKGGDNSIQEYGEEGDESELAQAAEELYGYLLARVDEDWARACSYLSREEIEQLEELGSKSPQLKNMGCAAVVEALSGGTLPESTKRELTEVDATSLRIEDEAAFLIYHGARNTGYFMRMVNEGGTWKVAALVPTAFP